jgi:hypothetical protein
MNINEKFWIILSFALSFVFTILIFFLWYRDDKLYTPNPKQLVDKTSVKQYLDTNWKKTKTSEAEPPIYVPTGIFIQSLKFVSYSDVNLSGYIWQKYTDGIHDNISRGFILPEVVDSNQSAMKREAYREKIGNQEIIGWYFEATLRQEFDYLQYPLDHKTVWIRLWPKDFDRNIILVPDLVSYDSTKYDDKFGIEKEIVMNNWLIDNTFFEYRVSNYDTNFGIDNYIGQKNFPELYYNIVIKRKFLNAFIINLVPLLVVSIFLFGMTMTITADKEKKEHFGFSVSEFLATCSALFFVIMLAHIQLRQQMPSGNIVYMESFYLLMYFIILGVAINAFLFPVKWSSHFKIVKYKDNIVPKILYWPIILGTALILTYIFLS